MDIIKMQLKPGMKEKANYEMCKEKLQFANDKKEVSFN